jgi:hypothetical protein
LWPNSREEEEDVPDEEIEVHGGADLLRLLAYRNPSLGSLKNLVRILDIARSADYHHCARGTVRDASGLQKRSRRNSAPVDSPLLDRIRLVFLAVTDLDGLITFRLD